MITDCKSIGVLRICAAGHVLKKKELRLIVKNCKRQYLQKLIEKNNIRACNPIFHALSSLSLFLIVILHISCLRCRHKKIYLYYSILFPIIYFLHHTSLRIFILFILFRIFSRLSHSPISLVQFLSFSLSLFLFLSFAFFPLTLIHTYLYSYISQSFFHIQPIFLLSANPFLYLFSVACIRPSFTTDSYPQISQCPDCS